MKAMLLSTTGVTVALTAVAMDSGTAAIMPDIALGSTACAALATSSTEVAMCAMTSI